MFIKVPSQKADGQLQKTAHHTNINNNDKMTTNMAHMKHTHTKQTTVIKACKSVYHHTVQINQPTRWNSFSSLLLDVYVQLNMFRASSRPSSGAQQLQ